MIYFKHYLSPRTWKTPHFHFIVFEYVMNFCAPLLGTIDRITAAGIFVLVNEKSYKTEKKFIPKESVGELFYTLLKPGDRIRHYNNEVSIYNFGNCSYCHKSYEPSYMSCSCNNAKNSITSRGILTNMVSKVYPSGYATKITIEHDEKKTYAVIFNNSALYPTISSCTEGDLIYYKGFVKDEGDHGRLVQMFHMQK